MKRPQILFTAVSVAIVTAACGGGDSGSQSESRPATSAQEAVPGLPSWYRVSGNTIELDIVAGATPDLQYFNFNGATNGAMTITVPLGSQVTVRFMNKDPNMPHSIGVASTADFSGQLAAEPVFPGAISSDPTSMTESTLSGELESFTFIASEAGEYRLVCYIPGHALAGMWVRFVVGGEAGVSGAPNVPISIN